MKLEILSVTEDEGQETLEVLIDTIKVNLDKQELKAVGEWFIEASKRTE